ncbi:MAG: DUF4115 domain-containing protein [Rhizobiales bacterium]|nr:DUF4115 domain-containing protein [Hyphomicrobiales bacterium]
MDQLKQPQPQEQFSFYRQRPQGDIDPTGEAGWYLQRERERRRLTLDQAGEACGIHPHHLEGIELGDLTRLPPRTESLRMIGIYAQFLGFDPQPLILHYTQFLPQPMPIAKTAKPRRPRPLSSAKIIPFVNIEKLKSYSSGAGGIVASVLAAIVVFQGMVFVLSPESNTGGAAKTEIQAGHDRTAKIDSQHASGEIVASISKVTETELDDADGTRIGQLAHDADQSAGGLSGLTALIEKDVVNFKVPIPRPKPVALGGAKSSSSKTAAVDQIVVEPASTGRVHGAANTNARLVLKAKAPVWIRIEDQQGNVVMTQTLNKGDTYRVPARDGLIVIARDGGLINYSIDGVDKGPLGDHGEILVGRSLDIPSLG